ncbi:MAG: metallophosphoesterase [Sulfurovum sp.]|nr:metallophosphoesterase [Sulfurovum sp.]
MKSGELTIAQGALFIADSHYPHHGEEFLTLLQKLKSKEIVTPQLFLMGDNFDLLFGYNDYIQTFSKEAIALLQELSQTMEIHYFEGNHDFCLKPIFPDMHVYSRAQQPLLCDLAGKKVGISHGDRYETGLGYELYCKALRNPVTLTLLRPFEKAIIDHRMAKLSQKHICRKFEHFEVRAEAILSHYAGVDLVIEGHFHQARVIGKYISLPSLACQKQVGVLKSGKIVFVGVNELY